MPSCSFALIYSFYLYLDRTGLLIVALYFPTGSANTMLSGQEVSEANDLVKDMKGLNSKSGSTIL